MLKIAIIDDDLSVRNSLEIVLKAHGHLPSSFSDPRNFLASVDFKNFDFLLVDNDMPYMTGLELHSWLKNNFPKYPKFVLMSGRLVDEDFAKLDASSQITLLTKPFPMAKLLQVLIL